LFPTIFVVAVYTVRFLVPPPQAVARLGTLHPLAEVQWFSDQSWLDEAGERRLEQSVFDEIFRMIDEAQSLILVDLFLFNDWQGPVAETHRAISDELVSKIVERVSVMPDLQVVFITDPVNTVYGGMESPYIERLRTAGVHVVLTNLVALQDSNPVYSALWRLFARPLGNARGTMLPNPFGEGRVSLRSWLSLLNFKANHRKLIVTDSSKGHLQAMISSANPHDGSSAHRNIGIRVAGEIVNDVLDSERALLSELNAEDASARQALRVLDQVRASLVQQSSEKIDEKDSKPSLQGAGRSIQLATESGIRDAVLNALDETVADDEVLLSMFYLSHRKIVKALKRAAARGVKVRALLDINSDAFGRKKNGVPNVPVAAELVSAGVDVRWCATKGEQCHEKSMLVRTESQLTLITGSGNFTRRNLDDYNLEADLVLRGPLNDALLSTILKQFDRRWNNLDNRVYSKPYEEHANDSLLLTLQYRFMEATGLGTF